MWRTLILLQNTKNRDTPSTARQASSKENRLLRGRSSETHDVQAWASVVHWPMAGMLKCTLPIAATALQLGVWELEV